MRIAHLAFLLALLAAPLARAQITFELALPLLRFKVEPPTVIIKPGVRVVPAYDEEIFVHERVYWLRRGDRWYRAPDHRGGWVLVRADDVPGRLIELPPGHYKHFKPGKHPGKGHGNGKGHGKGKGKGRR